MANYAGLSIQQVTVPATGTGSVYFTDVATPYASLQLFPLLAATDVQVPQLFYSNVGPRAPGGPTGIQGDPNTPVTSSLFKYVWAGPDASFSGTIVPASAFLTSSIYNIGNLSARYLRVDVPSVVGGVVYVALNRKA